MTTMALRSRSGGPILSICIPTFNRARLLECSLLALAPQLKATNGLVELIVSDNCSTDDTAEVVGRAQRLGPIRYHRNKENLGPAGNFLVLTNELASGQFAWIIGDDDLIRIDGVARVLKTLQEHPEVDYVFVNLTTRLASERKNDLASDDSVNLLPTKCADLSEHVVQKWEDLVDPRVDDVFLGAPMCSVFRLSVWKSYRLDLKAKGHYSTLEAVYPHGVILGHTMMGRKAYYLGYPCLTTYYGAQEWLGYLPLIVTVILQQLLDFYCALGIDRQQVEKCRSLLLTYSRRPLQLMLLDHSTLGREFFSLHTFLWRNRYHPAEVCKILRSILVIPVIRRLPPPVFRVLRLLRKRIRERT